MAKCIVMNVENPKETKFEVCVNGEQFVGDTDVEIEMKEMFIHALENAVVITNVPDPSKTVKLGEIYKIPKRIPRFRVVRLDGKRKESEAVYTQLEEGEPPQATTIKELKKHRGNPNWRKGHKAQTETPVPAEPEHQLTEA